MDDDELFVPSADDFDEADAAAMQAACVGQDLSDPAEQRIVGFVAMPGIKSSSREGAAVNLICGHTAEGARTARSLAAYFARPDVQASSHVAIDAAETLALVPYSRAAWTLRSGNPYSDNAEICGFAGWSRAEWLSTGTVDGCVNPRAMLNRFAAWVAARCKARGIPTRRLSLASVRDFDEGVIHHDDWTKAMHDGTHWDCGPGFPWDYVLAKARGDEKEWWEMQIPTTELKRIAEAVRDVNADPNDTTSPSLGQVARSTFKAVLRDYYDNDAEAMAAAIVAKLPAGAPVEVAVVKQAVKDALREGVE